MPSAAAAVLAAQPAALRRCNVELARRRTVGGRVGSGMGSLIESLWGFEVGADLPPDLELAWMAAHGYNDFAVLAAGEEWDPSSRAGEHLRIEVKSMNLGAREPKGHFDALASEVGAADLLSVLVWDWSPLAGTTRSVVPRIVDAYLGPACHVAQLRDRLHRLRGGSFVAPGGCPDHPGEPTCAHVGEPINSSGTRERKSGPAANRGAGAGHAANFGGLVRMLKLRPDGLPDLAAHLAADAAARAYVDFIHRSRPSEELNCFPASLWRASARTLGEATTGRKAVVADRVRAHPGYRDVLLAAARDGQT